MTNIKEEVQKNIKELQQVKLELEEKSKMNRKDLFFRCAGRQQGNLDIIINI